ncbi:MAG: pyruvate dehydrogenase (acetyl-transferring) E1 component subunit alpha [Planctomycetota bacterium]
MAEMLQVLDAATKAAKLPSGLTPDDCKTMYRAMLATRLFDQRGMNLQRQGRIGFCVPSMGQEASQIGTAFAATKEDWIYPSYRTHSIAILRGVPFRTLIDQLYGNATDIVKGRQMPNHFSLRQWNMVSISSPIGTQISQAAGTARAIQIRGEKKAVWTYFGDGGTSEGEFHCGMNFAGVWKAPCIFVCENNQWAISVPVRLQTASESFAAKAIAYGMPGVKVDGNDVLAVYQAAKEARERAIAGGGPTLIETFTFRQGPHSSSDDPKRYQPPEMLETWKKKDPIARFQAFLEKKKLWTPEWEKALTEEITADLAKAVDAAEQTPAPAVDTMFDDVYATLPPHLVEQREAVRQQIRTSGAIQDTGGKFPL